MGYFLPGSPCANDAGMDFRRKHWTTDEVKAMLDKAGYDGGPIVLHAPDRPAHLQRAVTLVAVGGLPQGRHQYRRADDGLGHDRAAAHVEGGARQRRLVDVPRRRAGPGISSIPCSPTRCAAMARRHGSVGPTIRSWKRLYEAWIDAPDDATRRQVGARVPVRRRSPRCRPSRSANICRRRRGDRTSPGW